MECVVCKTAKLTTKSHVELEDNFIATNYNQYQYSPFRDKTSHNLIELGLFFLLSCECFKSWTHPVYECHRILYFWWILYTVLPVTILREIRFLFELTQDTTKLLHQILVMQWLWCCLDSMRKFPKENAEILLYIFPRGQQLLRPYQVSHAYDLFLLPLLWNLVLHRLHTHACIWLQVTNLPIGKYTFFFRPIFLWSGHFMSTNP